METTIYLGELSVGKTQMPKSDNLSRMTILEHLMLSRLAQSEQMREFFIQMWIQNPALAKQGGIKVQNLLSPISPAFRPKGEILIFPKSTTGFTVDIEGDGK